MYNLINHIEQILEIHGRSVNSIQWAGLSEMISIDWPTFRDKVKDIVIDPENGKNLGPSLVVMGDSWFIRVTDYLGLTGPELEFIKLPVPGQCHTIEDSSIFLDEIPQ
jgi:hypothetical protein